MNPMNPIKTFADCIYRKEELLPNRAFESLGMETSTDMGLLDWSECTHPNRKSASCECSLSERCCPEGFAV